MDTQAPIDPESVQNLKGLDEDSGGELFREIVDLFLNDAPAKIERIQQGIAASDPVEVTQGAHSLKGSAGNFGAHRLVQLCAEMERLGVESNIQSAPDLLASIQTELEGVAQALRSELVSSPSGS